jgi:DNA mismatch repair protein MutS
VGYLKVLKNILMATSTPATETPVMKQYGALKLEAGDALLFFRMGDFYELFADDAVLAAKILNITLTSRDKKAANPIPMAGVPFHSAEGYIDRVLRAGYRVAIAEQTEDPSLAKGLVERKIIRTFTPAIQFGTSSDEAPRLALVISNGEHFTCVQFSPATGDLYVETHFTQSELLSDTSFSSVRHVLVFPQTLPIELLQALGSMDNVLLEELHSVSYSKDAAKEFLRQNYPQIVIEERSANSLEFALYVLLRYTADTQKVARLNHLKPMLPLRASNGMVLDHKAVVQLDGEELFQNINHTHTSMGARVLRRWFLTPDASAARIFKTQSRVRAYSGLKVSEGLGPNLKSIYDLDRLLGRIATGLANPRDIQSLAQSCKSANALALTLNDPIFDQERLPLLDALQSIDTLVQETLKNLKDELPNHTRDGGYFTLGAHPELDGLIRLTENAEQALLALESREREESGISNLKVKYNRVFGYFIEVSSANVKSVPPHFERRQTMTGAERFSTPELSALEDQLLQAGGKRKELEKELFDDLIARWANMQESVLRVSLQVARIDAFQSLATLLKRPGYSFPEINDSNEIFLKNCRHPVLEALQGASFVPNDFHMEGKSDRVWILTGPNMGGKSTLMRQIAQILWLGQIGAPVPATEARWGVIDGLFTRIGAQDALSQGRSTFMVEMTELAQILHQATKRSFIVLDEIGRGTSTFDGMSVAWASIEHLAKETTARVMVATHYQELTELTETLKCVRNHHLEVLEEAGKLRFSFKLKDGPSGRSFGIHVAELAGLPPKLIERSWTVLAKLESKQSSTKQQPSLFDQLNP